MSSKPRRVVITGVGVVCPLGSTKESLWEALAGGRSGVRAMSQPGEAGPLEAAAAAAAVYRRNRRLRSPGKGAEEGHPQGLENDVPRVPDGRRRRPVGPGRRPNRTRPTRSRANRHQLRHRLHADPARGVQRGRYPMPRRRGQVPVSTLGSGRHAEDVAALAVEVLAEHAGQPRGDLQRLPRSEQFADAPRGGGQRGRRRGLRDHPPRRTPTPWSAGRPAPGCTP